MSAFASNIQNGFHTKRLPCREWTGKDQRKMQTQTLRVNELSTESPLQKKMALTGRYIAKRSICRRR